MHSEYLDKLGKWFKYFRLKSGFKNYEQFAYANDISRAQYGRYEIGANISFKILIKIIKIHNISVEEFFSEGFDKV